MLTDKGVMSPDHQHRDDYDHNFDSDAPHNDYHDDFDDDDHHRDDYDHDFAKDLEH